MKIIKSFAVFLLTFLIGNSLVLPPDSDLSKKIELNLEPGKTQFCQLNLNKNEPKPKIFNVEGFWDKLENKSNKHLLELGEVSNGEDFKIKSGESWLGFYGKNKNTKLTSTKIFVKKTFDSDLDWTEFSTRTKEQPIFLVKNLKNVKQGKVKTLFRGLTWDDYDNGKGEMTSLKRGFEKDFSLGDKVFTLRVEDGVNEKQEHIWALTLESNEKKQIIYYIYYSGEEAEVGNLYWVGDLDSDGKLDLFMDFYNYEKGGYSSGLFLSSEAKNGKLVKFFEYFRLSAC